MVMVMVPSLSYSQTQRASDRTNVHAATTDSVEVRRDDPAANTASDRRSLMGMVMDVLIASAEQQSALEKAAHHADPANANTAQTAMTGAAATAVASTKSASSPDLATREQIAVESEP
jgi:dihydroxyacetone kinase